MFSVYADGQLIYFPIEEELTIHTPKLTLEMGKAGSFQFGMPPTNRYYDSLRQLRTIITVEYDDVEIFRGRVLTINRGFNKIRDIYCEGDLAYLVDSVQKGEKYEGTTHELFRKIIQNHNSRVEASKQFVVGNIGIENREIIITGQDEDIQSEDDDNKDRRKSFDWYKQIAINGMVDEWSTSFDYIQNSIIDYCGGYLKTRRVGNTTYIDLVQDYSGTSIQKIEFGTNLIDLTEEVKAEDVYTVLIPLGDENLTISKLDDFDESRLSKVGDELRDKTAISLYGRIVKTHVFDNVNKAETLLSNARRLLDSHENMPVTFTVKAVDMHMVDESSGAIYVGDRVYVKSIPHDITQYLTCTKIEYDFDNHANDTYTFGNPKQTMTERYKKDKEKQSKSGRSRGGGGGGSSAAAAVEEAQDFAVSNSKKTADEFFDAWINVDKEAGAISLGALYEQYKSGKTVLKNAVGIDLDAPKGTIDIYATHEKTESIGNVIKNNLGINLDAPQGTINIFADHHKTEKSAEILTNNLGINLDAPQGIIKIFDDHKRIDKTEGVITNNLGINLDAPQGIINIYDDHKKVNDAIGVITNNLGINMDAPQGKINIFNNSSLVDKMNRVFTTNLGISLDNPQGKISIFSEWSDVRNAVKSAARFETMAKGTEARAGIFTEYGNRIGSLEFITSNKSSELWITVERMIVKGDQEVEGKIKAQALEVLKANIGRLSTDVSTSGYIRAANASITNNLFVKSIDMRNGNLNVESGNLFVAKKPVATQEWVTKYLTDQLKNYAKAKHQHTVNIGHTHRVTVKALNTETGTGVVYPSSYSTKTTSIPI